MKWVFRKGMMNSIGCTHGGITNGIEEGQL